MADSFNKNLTHVTCTDTGGVSACETPVYLLELPLHSLPMDFWTTNPELAEKINSWGSMGLLILAALAIIFWLAQPKDSKTGWAVLLLFALYLIVVLPLCVCGDKLNYLNSYTSAYAWHDFGVPVGALIYIAGAKIFHFDIWDEVMLMLVKVKDRLLKRA